MIYFSLQAFFIVSYGHVVHGMFLYAYLALHVLFITPTITFSRASYHQQPPAVLPDLAVTWQACVSVGTSVCLRGGGVA